MSEFLLPQSHEKYGEVYLRQKLEFATNDLRPNANSNYQLSLEGIALPPYLRQELEVFCDEPLDTRNGVSITLGFHPLEQTLYLQKFTSPLEHQAGSASLLYNETLAQYLPFIHKPQIEFTKYNTMASKADGERILHELNINHPPVNDAASYRLWRAQLLSRTKGWYLREQVTIPTRIDSEGSAVNSLILANEQVYHPLRNTSSQRRSVAAAQTYFDHRQKTGAFLETIELNQNDDNQALSLFSQWVDVQKNGYVQNDTIEQATPIQPITLDKDSCTEFGRLLEDATDRLYRSYDFLD